MYRPHDSAALEWAVKRGRLRYAFAATLQDGGPALQKSWSFTTRP